MSSSTAHPRAGRDTGGVLEDHRQHPGLGFRRMKLRGAHLAVQLIARATFWTSSGLTPQLGEYSGSTLSGDFVDMPARFRTASEQARMRKSPCRGGVSSRIPNRIRPSDSLRRIRPQGMPVALPAAGEPTHKLVCRAGELSVRNAP